MLTYVYIDHNQNVIGFIFIGSERLNVIVTESARGFKYV